MNDKTSQLLCAHAALVPLIVIGAGWFFIPGWFPPLSPDLSPETVKGLYEDNTTAIRIGMTLTALCAVFWWPFSAAIAGQMKRMETGEDKILSRVEMAAASGSVMVILFSAYFVLAAIYRPYTPATTIMPWHDIAWLMFIGCYPPGFLQNLSIGTCILRNKTGVDVYPRWLGYANIWFAIATLPGALLPFFHSGPFSWNGVIGFWLVAVFFFLWIFVNWLYTVKAIKNQP
jgi:hypothetical protein